ncbi:hypothetical protein [Methylobacterium durans]|uniref:hypothetical protein n=1 Tax=Methylobacterium durans TaxID=2202825 RepID=UPI0013A55195|nr:hypothetical protein [Methylobacterium durans]
MTRLLILFAILPAAILNASARERSPERAALQRYCSGDLITYCDGLSPDGPEVRACFKTHMAELSPGCRKAIKRFRKDGT